MAILKARQRLIRQPIATRDSGAKTYDRPFMPLFPLTITGCFLGQFSFMDVKDMCESGGDNHYDYAKGRCKFCSDNRYDWSKVTVIETWLRYQD